MVRALSVEVPEALAARVALGGSPARARALRVAGPLHVAMRERFDEDWWRNPRSEEALRVATRLGAARPVASLVEELGADPDALGARVRELLR